MVGPVESPVALKGVPGVGPKEGRLEGLMVALKVGPKEDRLEVLMVALKVGH